METGGKIATGVLVPLAVGGAAVAAYFLLRGSKNKDPFSHISKPRGPKRTYGPDDSYREEYGGGKRRTHRRRR